MSKQSILTIIQRQGVKGSYVTTIPVTLLRIKKWKEGTVLEWNIKKNNEIALKEVK